MADITMCKEDKCPKAQECYRFLATPNEWRQSYFEAPKYDENGCNHFWEAKSKSEMRRLDIQTRGDK